LYFKAGDAADKALNVDPSLAGGYRIKGAIYLLHDWDFTRAEKSLRQALALDPSDAIARAYLALLMTAQKRFAESLAEMTSALALEPDSEKLNEQYAYILLQQRRFDEAIQQANKQSERGGSPYLYRILGDCYLAKGMHDQAKKVYRLSEDLGSSNAQVRVAAAMAAGGLKSEARTLLLKLEKNESSQFLSPDFMAAAFAIAGDNEKALEWLQKAYEAHADSMIMVKVNFFWDGLQNNPRFQNLTDRVFAKSR